MNRSTTGLRHACAALLLLALAACASGNQMMEAGAPAPVARPDRATIIFMRPSQLGFAVTAAVYDVDGPDSKFIAFVNAGMKVAHEVAPGDHMFMVVSEASDFLRATVEAGKTYYVLVTPRVGMWRARFSFRPVRQGEFAGEEFAGWEKATPQFYRTTPEAQTWAASNATSVAAKRAEYWPEWTAKPEEQRLSQTLHPQDGR